MIEELLDKHLITAQPVDFGKDALVNILALRVQRVLEALGCPMACVDDTSTIGDFGYKGEYILGVRVNEDTCLVDIARRI